MRPAGGELYTVYPGSVWGAQIWVGSGRRGVRVTSGSRVGKSVDLLNYLNRLVSTNSSCLEGKLVSKDSLVGNR